MLQHWLAAAGGAYYDDSCTVYPLGAGFYHRRPLYTSYIGTLDRSFNHVWYYVRRYCPGDKALRIAGGVMWVVVVLRGDTGRGMGRTGAGADSPLVWLDR